MNPKNINELLEQAAGMQSKMAELQRSLAQKRFEGSAGGGMVTAEVSGELRVLSLTIEPGLVESGDTSMIQDLCAAAVNAALGNAQRGVQEELQRLTGGMGLPQGLPFGGGSS